MNTTTATPRNRITEFNINLPTPGPLRFDFAEPFALPDHSRRVTLMSGSHSPMSMSIADHLAQLGLHIGVIEDEKPLAHDLQRGYAHMISGSLNDEASCDAVASRVFEQFDAVDTLIHSCNCHLDTPLHRLHRHEWNAVVRESLSAAYNLTRAFINPMRHRRSGRVIFMLEVPSAAGEFSATHQAGECAIEGLARELASENASHSITVNCIVAASGSTGVASLAGFLASQQAAAITGQVITVGVSPAL